VLDEIPRIGEVLDEVIGRLQEQQEATLQQSVVQLSMEIQVLRDLMQQMLTRLGPKPEAWH
jgi:hypothetical protein